MTKTHWKRTDYRISDLKNIISGLEKTILKLRKKIDTIEWYDGGWYMEESEPIYGLALIAIQNYINSSVFDRFENLDKQYLKYKSGNNIQETGRTDIELMIALANYFKHRDHPIELTGETPKILSDFNLQYGKDVEIFNSPIFEGIGILSINGDLDALVRAAQSWRENLWLSED